MSIAPMIGIVISIDGFIWLCILPLMGQTIGYVFRYDMRGYV